MRLFIALDIDESIRQRIAAYVDDLRRRVPGVRFVGAETYHVTLKFLGEVRDPGPVKQALGSINSSGFPLSFSQAGFFPNEKAPRVFWAGIHADERLPALARAIDEKLHSAGFPKEDRPFRAHLTLARSGSGSPKPRSDEHAVPGFRALISAVQQLAPPEFGTMTASEFFLYESKLSPRGAQYSKLARYPLG